MTHLLTLAAAALLAASAPAPAAAAVPAPAAETGPEQGPPPPRFPQDPADSLYRVARTALNQGEFRRAADLFRQIPTRYGHSAYAPDALYWEAFARYRLGGADELRAALDRLDEQRRAYPRAATRGDADALATRIRGSLARLGDAGAARSVARAAAEAARPASRAVPVSAAATLVRGDACPESEGAAHAGALNALVQMDPEGAAPVLREVLARRDACAGPLRVQALFLLAQTPTPDAGRILLQVARGDPDAAVRERAVFWLSQVPGEQALELLREVLGTATDDALRARAIFALSQRSEPEALDQLVEVARHDPDPEMRRRAIRWLGRSGDPRAARALADLLDR